MTKNKFNMGLSALVIGFFLFTAEYGVSEILADMNHSASVAYVENGPMDVSMWIVSAYSCDVLYKGESKFTRCPIHIDPNFDIYKHLNMEQAIELCSNDIFARVLNSPSARVIGLSHVWISCKLERPPRDKIPLDDDLIRTKKFTVE